jgi:putative heme-binding domain-containing protein
MLNVNSFRAPLRPVVGSGVRVLAVALALGGLTWTARAASSVPQPLPGWSVEVVAEAPRIQHPTVVACAPDGRVFVAEDPMDIRTPKADATEGRILCLHPDGRTTVFAEGLHAVFGLQYLEGRLYVLHNPQFSVFDDADGVGLRRRELIAQTLPEPWALNWNDHVPANFRLGMDGFFHVASGDKGLHGAKGTDGSTATLSSGGVFRIRPDGTDLAVESHGVRNILDVALNSEDEQFTYDNTDEHDWMGRFTHMVDGGFYGYPHDFLPRCPYTLWKIDDFGAGAACGVLANTEDALPPQYRDSLFLSDFGKRQILRVVVEREGGTYRTVSREDLFPNPPGDFRPVGITASPDGTALYLCDWQHRDEKAQVSVGRLLKLSWTGTNHSTAKPDWYVSAASGKAFNATVPELVRGLSHPSRSVRLTAQRRLSDRKAVRELTAVLGDRSASSLARVHALWALDAIEGGRRARAEIVLASSDSDPVVRRQALRQLGLRRVTQAGQAGRDALKDREASVRFQAATALGYLGDTKALPSLLNELEDSDPVARFAAFTALNRIGTRLPSSWSLIVRGLDHPSTRVREGVGLALRETYDLVLLGALTNTVRDPARPVAARRVALDLLGALHHRKPEWKGEWWAYHPALQPPTAKTESWAGTPSVLATLRAALEDRDAELRRSAIGALVAAGDTVAGPSLLEAYSKEKDTATRAAILRAVGAMKTPGAFGVVMAELRLPTAPAVTAAAVGAAEAIGGEEAVRSLIQLLQVREAGPLQLAAALEALGRLKVASTLVDIEPMTRHRAPVVRSAAMAAVAQLRGVEAIPLLETAVGDAELMVRRTAVKSLGELRSTNAVPALLRAWVDDSLRAEAFVSLTRTPDPRAIEVLLAGIASRNPSERDAAHLAIRNLGSAVLNAVEARAGTLPPQALVELRHIYAGNREAESGPLFARQIQTLPVSDYLAAALRPGGDPDRGRKIFAEPGGVGCVTCHRVAGAGGETGPDLTGAGAQFDRRALAEAILEPSRTVRDGYQLIQVEMENDEEISGQVKSETSDALVLRTALGEERRVAKAAIRSRRVSALSLMPEGLQSALTLEEFSDLIAYLESLRGQPKTSAER